MLFKLFVLFQLFSATLAEPPLGPRNQANCPVTGDSIKITQLTPVVLFENGQRLYFSSKSAAASYAISPRDYWLSPHEDPLAGVDGKRGLPDLRNETRHCPFTNESILISMQTPRVIHRHGQNVYFCCFGCVTSFWTDPKSAIVGTNF
jgi:YHS domain-containing protein